MLLVPSQDMGKTLIIISMRIVLIHTEAEADTAAQLVSLLKNMAILVDTFPAGPAVDPEKFMAAGVMDWENGPTLTLVSSELAPGWFDFLAGYSCGSQLPLLVYGEDAARGIPDGFSSCFRLLETEEALRNFLEKEQEDFKKQDAVMETAMGVSKARGALLQTGIPINEESLARCAGEGSIWEVSLFLAAGFSPDTRDKAGVPLLNISARKGNRIVLRFLILVGADLNVLAGDRGTSALIDSVMGKHYEMVSDLIKAGIDVNIKSKDGQTALVVAVGANDEKMVEALLKAGADPDISDHMGASARKYAALFKNSTITALFETYAPEKTV